MAKTKAKPADFIQPLYINGLHGRIMYIPASRPGKKREIMYIQGHHSSLERNFGVAQLLSRYGNVTVPDLPGFGGMDSFYKIGEKPTLDNLADYLAAVIKLRYRGRTFTLTGLSLGFMLITRMLQKYPHIAKQVNFLISFAGIADKSDFNYRRRTYWLFRSLAWFFSLRLPGNFLKYFVFRSYLIKLAYNFFEPIFVKASHSKIRKMSPDQRKALIDFEVHLWKSNDARTYMSVGHTMFKLNLLGKHVDQKVYHIAVANDRYFNNVKVEEHLRAIYRDVRIVNSKIPAHAPSIIATAKEASPYLPAYLRRILNKPV